MVGFYLIFSIVIQLFISINCDQILKDGEIKNITLNDFISGNLTLNNIDYYSLKITEDADEIFIDWQSEYGCIMVNIGEIKPTKYESHFVFCTQKTNFIYTLNKKEILEKYIEEGRETIKDLNIIIGIINSNRDIIPNFYYSFKISLSKKDINITEIKTEHKILCNSEKINNKYRCLYVIISDENKINSNLIINPISLYNYNLYADFIDKKYYEEWNTSYLINKIPNNSSIYTNNNNFIYIPITKNDNYIYVCIETEIDTIIELISSFSFSDIIKEPIINNIQLYSVQNEYTNLNFNNTQKLFDEITLNIIILISLIVKLY